MSPSWMLVSTSVRAGRCPRARVPPPRARITSSSPVLTRLPPSRRPFATTLARRSEDDTVLEATPDSPARLTSYLPSESSIHAVPYSISPKVAVQALDIGAMAHSAFLTKSILSGLLFAIQSMLPKMSIGAAKCELVDVKAVYLPGWSVAAELAVQTGAGDKMDISTRASFFPGTSFSPLSQMILGPTLYDLPDYIPTYKPSRDLDQYDTPITPIPFDTSPLILPSLIRESLPIPLDAVDVEDPIVDEPEWKQLDCVPMYFPIYVARYKNDKRGQDFTIVMEAGNSKPGNYTIHYPTVAPLLKLNTPEMRSHHPRPLTQMVYRHSALQRPLPSWLVPALALTITSPPGSNISTAASEGKLGYRDSMSSRLSAVLEKWVEGEDGGAEGRALMRERTMAGPKEAVGEGKFEGKLTEWEQVEKGGYAEVVEKGQK